MRSVHTIPANVPFLEALAAELLRCPTELPAARVLLPTRRACLELRDAFSRRSGGRALLLPRLEPIGELDEDEPRLDPELALELTPAVPPLRRRLLLTRLVLARGDLAHEQAIRLAGELAAFLDEVQTEGVDLEGLPDIVPATLAEHWQEVLRFLDVVREAWPAVLAAEGRLDPALRRARLMAAVARHWAARPPAGLVIVAGVTGSIPAVAELLATIAALPRGTVILPGLDLELDEASWAGLEPSHPQWVLKGTLERIGIQRAAVRAWPCEGVAAGSRDRVRLLSEVMRPAATSERWRDVVTADAAAHGLELVEARDLAEEALLLALRTREALEVPGKRVALVTADRNLARRVAVELARWGIRADDSAGVPLDQSPPGSFLLLIAHAIVEELPPAALLAMLKHPLASGGLGQGAFRRYVRALERTALRGPRPAPGFDGLRRALVEHDDAEGREPPVARAELAFWLDGLARGASTLTGLVKSATAPFAELLEAHLTFAEWLAGDETGAPVALWDREAGAALHQFVAALREAADVLDGVPTSSYPALLAVLMSSCPVRPRAPGHPRVAILGQLESRLGSGDLVLVGGLVDGVWPRRPESGPWLNRTMRAGLGLPPLEQQIGIAAHDFVQAACAPEVVLSRARADEQDRPTTPSRWLARLGAVLEVTGKRAQVAPDPAWAAWAATLQGPSDGEPAPAPSPRPPAAARPRSYWASDVEQLIRNPYGLYAKRVLGLKALDPIDADPGQAERGQIIHAILDQFVRELPGELPDDALEQLTAIGMKRFGAAAGGAEVMTLWWPRFERIGRWFLEVERARRTRAISILTELQGETEVEGGFKVRARADRVEVGRDGSVAILDYKTGSAPKPDYVALGIVPQMPIEALIAEAGGFAGVPGVTPTELLYLALKGGEPEGEIKLAGGNAEPAQLVTAARAGLIRLLAHFADEGTAYAPVPRPEIAPAYDNYAHLARVGEWRSGGRDG